MHKNHFSCYNANRICIVHSHFAVFKYLNFDFLRPWKCLEKGIVSHTGVHSGVSPVEIRHYDPRWRYATMIIENFTLLVIHYSHQIHALNTKWRRYTTLIPLCQRIPWIKVTYFHRRYAIMISGQRYAYLIPKNMLMMEIHHMPKVYSKKRISIRAWENVDS